jgi:hypothetical protein
MKKICGKEAARSELSLSAHFKPAETPGRELPNPAESRTGTVIPDP